MILLTFQEHVNSYTSKQIVKSSKSSPTPQVLVLFHTHMRPEKKYHIYGKAEEIFSDVASLNGKQISCI